MGRDYLEDMNIDGSIIGGRVIKYVTNLYKT
jgi:hypothetical protein